MAENEEPSSSRIADDPEQPKPSTGRPKTNEEIEKEDLELLKALHKRAAHRLHRFHLKAIGPAALNWDYAADRPPAPNLSNIEGIMILLKSSLGGGVYVLHKAYAKSGLWIALFINIVLGYANVLWSYVLVNAIHMAYGRTRVPMMSYGDLAEACLDIGPFLSCREYSKVLRYAVDAMLIVAEVGNCFSYHVKAAKFLKELFEGDDNPSAAGLRPYIGALILPIGAVCMITQFRQVVIYCLISNAFSLLTAFATVYFGSLRAKKSFKDYPLYNSVNGIIAFVPECSYSLTCINTLLPVENVLARPDQLWKVLLKVMTFSIIVTVANGFFGYYGFGEHGKSLLTYNFHWSGLTMNIRASAAFIMCITYCIHFWTPFHCIWFYVKGNHKPETHWYMERVYRGVLVAAISILALATPFNGFFDVSNTYLMTFLTFVVPSFMELCMVWDDPGLGKYNWRFWKFLFLVGFGITIIIVAVA